MNISSWSDLPKELLEEVVKHLRTRPGFLNFRAVCKSWEDSAPRCLLPSSNILHPIFPQEMQPSHVTSLSGLDKQHKLPVLVPTSVCLVRPLDDPTQRPWLAFVEEINSGKLCSNKIIHPPNRHVKISGDTVLNLSCLHVSVLCQGIKFRTERLPPNYGTYCHRAVLFLNPAVRYGLNPRPEDCTVIVLDQFALFAYRMRTDGKHVVEKPNYCCNHAAKFTDIVNFKGQVYAIDEWGSLYAVNYRSLDVRVLNSTSDKRTSCFWQKRLVASSDELYKVSHSYEPIIRSGHFIKIYKIGAKSMKWKRVSKIGDDRVLIMTRGDCFFVSVKDFPDWEGNCVVLYQNQKIFKYYFEEARSRKRLNNRSCVMSRT